MIRNSLNCQHLRVPAIGIDWDEKLFSFGYVVAHGIWKSLCMDQKITFLQFSIRLVLVPGQPASLVLSQESVDSLIKELSEKRCSKVYGLCQELFISASEEESFHIHVQKLVKKIYHGTWRKYSKSFLRGGSDPRSNPLPFYKLFLTEKVPLWYTFYWQMVLLSHT